ncbi:MAG TPA: ABC transporter substrate-binding protein [Thermomicrobiales bacterium]|nr:ABC transporter substrate-binding protein [Thermomicrobiales bacterium]
MAQSGSRRTSPLERAVDRRTLFRGTAAGLGLLAVSPLLTAGGVSAQQATASASAATPGGTLLFNGGSNLSGLDPHTTGAVVSWYTLDNIFDRLMRLNPETQQPEPSLAEKVEVSDDGLTYTFTLRQGVKFHNGRVMTSEDVKKTIERIQDPNVPAVAKGYFASLGSIETPDEQTVKLVYKEVYAPLLIALTRLETAIVPMEEVEKKDQWEQHPVGSGPFKFDSYVKDQAVVMSKNADYWESGLPYLDSVQQKVITQMETAVINVRTGDIQATPIQASDIEGLKESKDVQVVNVDSTYWAHLSLNNRRKPFDDVKVRQAIRLGVNRDDIKELAFFGTGTVSNTLIPEGNPFRAEVDGWTYDPDKAKSLLKEAGLDGGFSTKLRIVSSQPWEVAASQIIQQNLADLKIQVEIEQIEATTWFSEVFTDHDFDMSMTSHVSKVDPDLSMFDILHSGDLGTKNYTGFNDPEMDKLLDEGRATTDADKRMSIYTDAQKVFVERSGYIVLNLQVLPFALTNNVQDFLLLPTSELRWKGTWLKQ